MKATLTADEVRNGWQIEAPERDGWWEFRELGECAGIEVFILGGCVASDWELACETGRESELNPDDDSTFLIDNYWEGEEVQKMTDGTYTRGVWRFIRSPQPLETGEAK